MTLKERLEELSGKPTFERYRQLEQLARDLYAENERLRSVRDKQAAICVEHFDELNRLRAAQPPEGGE